MRNSSTLWISLAVLSAGCSTPQDARAPETTETAVATAAPVEAAAASAAPSAEPAATVDPKAEAEAKKKAEEQKKLADDFAKLDKERASEKSRMSDPLRKELADLSSKTFPNFKGALEAAMKAGYRTPGAKDRDAQRRPVDVLTFFQLKQDMQVLELDAGAGWYTELLAPVLKKKGKLTVAGPDPSGPTSERSTLYGQRLRALLDKAPELGDKVDYVVTDANKGFAFDAKLHDSFDTVLAFRTLHNWQRRGVLDKNIAEVYAVLKPGGVFAVEAHRAKAGADPKASAEKGYLPQDFVVERAKAAGFELGGTSEINANPKDTTDHPDGVWSLPPTLRGGDKDKDKFVAIGESDRMTLRFVKPKKAKKP
ncbi:MAG: class I SAM-dependent methyltransferase [Polyangiaceae bacterium]|nr:class I SAM-dependent methyltransferase [Polyangiaceae bacterium]